MKTYRSPDLVGVIRVALFGAPVFFSTSVEADSQNYAKPPVTAFNSQMEDVLLDKKLSESAIENLSEMEDEALVSSKYEKPVWNLHDFLGLPNWLSVGVEQRTRYEDVNGTFRANTQGGDQQIALQTNLWLQARINKFRIAAEFMDARALDTDIGPGKNVGSGVNNNMADTVDFLQAYFSWADKHAFSSDLGLEVRVGRQTMDFGSRRLVGRNYFRNTINNFTGVRLRILDNSNWQLNTFATMPVIRFPNTATAILNDVQQFDQEATRTWFSGGFLEAFNLLTNINAELYLYNLDEADSFNNPTRKRRYFTPGFRFYRKPAKGRFDFQAEAMGQFGTVRYNTTSSTDQRHDAWSEHIEAGYTFDMPWSPRFMLEYDYASGSKNPSTTSVTDSRFDPLYGVVVTDFGPSGIYGAFSRSNINSPGYKLFLAPAGNLSFVIRQRLIWLASASDCWGGASCTSSSNLVLQPTKYSGSYVGNQLGITARYDFNSSLNFETGWYHLFKGQFAKQGAATVNGASTVPGQDTDYFYVQSQLRF